MRIGFGLPVSGSWARPDVVTRVAQRADQLGFASLWTFQRLLVPIGTDRPTPAYASVLDPIAAMAFAAAVTTRARLGVAVVNLPFVSPVLLGKQLASIDVLSGGRLVTGLGLGHLDEEFVATGAQKAGRGARAEEFLAALTALWGPDPVAHHGPHYDIPASSVLPKPVQRPRPPVLLGANSRPALERVGRLADGWISSSRTDLTTISHPIATITAAAERAGRDPGTLELVCRGRLLLGERTGPLTGTVEQVREDLEALAAAGLTETFLDLNFDPRIGDPAADPATSEATAHEVLAAFAPG